jgi:hypothetical protein
MWRKMRTPTRSLRGRIGGHREGRCADVSERPGVCARECRKLPRQFRQVLFRHSASPADCAAVGPHTANERANAFAEGEDRSCPRAFLNAMLSLQQRPRSLGAHAVVNIVSYFRKKEVSSTRAFECHEGTLMAGVTLKEEMVRFAGRQAPAIAGASRHSRRYSDGRCRMCAAPGRWRVPGLERC